MNQSVRILTLAVLASLVACTPSWAQDAVPARNDPLHITKLENEYVRVFNVYIPPGKSTTFHEHAFDFSVVFVEGSKLKNEMMAEQRRRSSSTQALLRTVVSQRSRWSIASRI